MKIDLIHSEEYSNILCQATIIGVTGTNGAGKDSLMDLLSENGFLVYNTSDHLRAIAMASLGSTDRGGNQSPMGLIANQQRSYYPGGMVELGLLEWVLSASHLPDELRPRGLVIGSIRGLGEAERLQNFGGKLVVVDADSKLRYQRITQGRGRQDDQGLSYELFMEKELAELAPESTDPTKFSMQAVIDRADLKIINNTTIDDFRKQVVTDFAKINVELSL